METTCRKSWSRMCLTTAICAVVSVNVGVDGTSKEAWHPNFSKVRSQLITHTVGAVSVRPVWSLLSASAAGKGERLHAAREEDGATYGQLSASDKKRLDTAHRDLVLLWGALDMYADSNRGRLPRTLDELVPLYLKELPADPFADETTASNARFLPGYGPSKDGWGYWYLQGAPGSRAWIIRSVGLVKHPDLAARENVRLSVVKGAWRSGRTKRVRPAVGGQLEDRDDFRSSDAYKRLSKSDKEKLDTANRDLVLLWGALDMYADSNDGKLPETLDELVSLYLKELPADPFADEATACDAESLPGYAVSNDGWGYRYRRGAPGNHAWIIRSVGSAKSLQLPAQGNVRLSVSKGKWRSGINERSGGRKPHARRIGLRIGGLLKNSRES